MISFLLIFIMLPFALLGQDMSSSIGLVTISDNYGNSDHKLEFLNEDGAIWYTLNLYDDLAEKPDLKIIAFKPDYFLFQIRCKAKTPTRFEVVVNEDTGLTKFLVNSAKLKFQTWNEYVISVFSVDFDRSKVKIYDRVGGAEVKEYPKGDKIFVPKEVKGEWMKVIWSDTNEYPSNSSSRTGWIRWKKGNKIVVTIYHLS